MTDPKEIRPTGRLGGTVVGNGLPKSDTEVAQLLQRKFAIYSLIWDSILPDLPFLEDCIHRVSVLRVELPGADRTRLHCLTLKLFQLREALDV